VNPRERRVVGGLVLIVALIVAVTLIRDNPSRVPTGPRGAPVMGLALPTPPAGGMTVYRVTNGNAEAIDVLHTISDQFGFRHSFWTLVPAGGDVTIHLRDVAQVPSPFQGSVELTATQPFIAEVLGFDLQETPTAGPSSTVTPTPTLEPSPAATQTPFNSPTATVTPSPSSTYTPTVSPVPTETPTPTLTPTVTVTRTPTVSPTITVSPTPIYLGLRIVWGCMNRNTGALRATNVEWTQPPPGCPPLFDPVQLVVGK
jgi:hypothetical protein